MIDPVLMIRPAFDRASSGASPRDNLNRQSLQEYEQRVHTPIRLILGGLEGRIFIIERASMLLPLSFAATDLA